MTAINQTNPDHLKVIENSNVSKKGIGLFVFKMNGQTYLLKSIRSIPADMWICSTKCSETTDCQHLSDVCLCIEGQFF